MPKNYSPSMTKVGLPSSSPGEPLDGIELLKVIWVSASPEAVVKALPAQSVYMALRAGGDESASELVSLLSLEQYRLVLDFELWRGDSFAEDNFWRWLAVIDNESSGGGLVQLLKAIDRRLLVLIFTRYVRVFFLEEPSDAPPAERAYTPDKGRTWISIDIEDEARHRSLGRLLAALHESNTVEFYQLLGVVGAATSLEMEDKAYQEQQRRLQGEGIPDHETSWRLLTAIAAEDFLKLLAQEKRKTSAVSRYNIQPLLSEFRRDDFLSGLHKEIAVQPNQLLKEQFEGEFSLLANAAMVFWRVPFCEPDEENILLIKLGGMLRVGIERAEELSSLSPIGLFQASGLSSLLRLGRGELERLRVRAHAVKSAEKEEMISEQALQSILSALLEPIPMLPRFFSPQGGFLEDEPGKLKSGLKAFESLAEVRAMHTYLDWLGLRS